MEPEWIWRRLPAQRFPHMQRPRMRCTSVIPVIRVQVVPKSKTDYLQVSTLTEKVLQKRLEQLEGVSLVDINGRQQGVVTIKPDKEQLMALRLDEETLSQTIKNANQDIGGLSVKDGQYRYFVKLANVLTSLRNGSLIVRTNDGTILPFKQLAEWLCLKCQPVIIYITDARDL